MIAFSGITSQQSTTTTTPFSVNPYHTPSPPSPPTRDSMRHLYARSSLLGVNGAKPSVIPSGDRPDYSVRVFINELPAAIAECVGGWQCAYLNMSVGVHIHAAIFNVLAVENWLTSRPFTRLWTDSKVPSFLPSLLWNQDVLSVYLLWASSDHVSWLIPWHSITSYFESRQK